MRRAIFILLSILTVRSVPCQSKTIDRALFERLVAITKHFEGWHTRQTTPGYVGYGHQIQKGERFPKTLTRQYADLLLRTDLLRHLRLYACYGKDAYLLAALSYQIGPAKLLGNAQYPKSTLLKRLEHGDRDILPLYLSYCKWKGKTVASIRKRRWVEYQLLFAGHFYYI